MEGRHRPPRPFAAQRANPQGGPSGTQGVEMLRGMGSVSAQGPAKTPSGPRLKATISLKGWSTHCATSCATTLFSPPRPRSTRALTGAARYAGRVKPVPSTFGTGALLRRSLGT
eukprot:695168-Pyramimonas_sp.AAC.1